jgi:membrane fusion protein (multidrug efflux system)|tara:strand:- start:6533 stop:7711 length:1179 start_codon:yes stop_codon:yes gene_type:complete
MSSAKTLAGLVILVPSLWLSGCGTPEPSAAPPPPEVGVVTLHNETAVLSSELPGRVVAAETSEVRPQVNGIIRHRLFEEGSIVEAGQLLYEIEDAPYRAALRSAQAALTRAEASINATRLQAERYQELASLKAASRQDADNAQAAADQASAEVEVQQAAIHAAKVDLGFTRIRAPISGRIGRSLVTPGALVQAGQAQPLATIQRTDVVHVDVMQSAAETLDLREAMLAGDLIHDSDSVPVELLLPNGNVYPIEGQLQFSEISVNPTTGAVTLRASFANPDDMLLPGMYVRARLSDGVRQQAILAPQQGITRDVRGRAVALIVDAEGKVEQRFVTAERAIGNRWMVTEGLHPGDQLIVEGRHRASSGALVTSKPWAPSSQPASPQVSTTNPGE